VRTICEKRGKKVHEPFAGVGKIHNETAESKHGRERRF